MSPQKSEQKTTQKSQYSPKVDAYIASAPAFAQPILEYLRDAVHAGCPNVQETMKWGRPHFDYQGILCGMSAFKEHCAFGFWKGSLIVAKGDNKNIDAMGQFGRITAVKDLPSKKKIVAYVHAAMKLNESGVLSPMMANRKKHKPLPVPKDLAASLGNNRQAKDTFGNFSPSAQREYIAWIIEAKAEETRQRRLAQAVEWMAEGKQRNWKYRK